MTRFSIIIPCYNVEKYVVKCVDSVLNQNYSDYEIIIINDGSTDDTLKICKEIQKNNDKVKIFSQKNGGLSSARNLGIQKSNGEYFIFLDSDDYLMDNNFLSDVSDVIESNFSELIIFGYKKVCEKDGSIIFDKPSFIKENELSIIESLIEQNYYKASACDKIIRSDIVKKNNMKFPLNFKSEDISWCSQILRYVNCDKIDVINKNVYAYVQRNNSITKTVKEQNIIDMISQIESFRNMGYIIDNYLAYEYSVVLGLISSNKVKNVSNATKKRVFLQSDLLKFCLNKKVKKVYICKKIFGIRLTSKILGIFISYKRT